MCTKDTRRFLDVFVHRVPVAERPQLILSAEEELGITAGLQDRVIQVLHDQLPLSRPLPHDCNPGQ